MRPVTRTTLSLLTVTGIGWAFADSWLGSRLYSIPLAIGAAIGLALSARINSWGAWLATCSCFLAAYSLLRPRYRAADPSVIAGSGGDLLVLLAAAACIVTLIGGAIHLARVGLEARERTRH